MKRTASKPEKIGSRVFAGVFGSLLGLAFLKFGNPVVLDRLVEPPANALEYLFHAWPVRWGYVLLVGSSLLGLTLMRWPKEVPRWVVLLPCAWFAWQLAASIQTVDWRLTAATLNHFGACLACFFLGLLALSRARSMHAFWTALLIAFGFMLWIAFEQHYGGLDATRKMFYEQPNWQQYPPDYIKKIESNRVFSTLVYPNALAGAILLLAPIMLVSVWNLPGRLTDLSRAVLTGTVAYAALACLYWSGSKSGWLIALVLVLAALMRLPLSRRVKATILAGVLTGGLAGFFVTYASYFQRGAPSVSARFEYWRAAARTAVENPVLGTGPGTFSVAYRKVKPPEAEMAQLTHNDYLEQASDSGFMGLLTYSAFVLGSIILLARHSQVMARHDLFAVWTGLLGWALQGFVEFLLYIPALAWTAFALFGWLWAKATENNEFDSRARPS